MASSISNPAMATCGSCRRCSLPITGMNDDDHHHHDDDDCEARRPLRHSVISTVLSSLNNKVLYERRRRCFAFYMMGNVFSFL
jgi:bifunctional DNase/RNase